MRASIDWPHWATSTRSSMAPRRNGPKISSHGCGREPMPARNVAGTDVQESGDDIVVSAATREVERGQSRWRRGESGGGKGGSRGTWATLENPLLSPRRGVHVITR